MDSNFKEFLTSGKALLTDTKTIKPKSTSVKGPKKGMDVPLSQDSHKVLVKRCIDDRIPKKDVVEEFKKFIDAAEAEL